MNSVDVWKIIQDLKLIPAITSIVWTNIFFWEPRKDLDISTNSYIVINIISQIPSFAQRQARLEFRLLWKIDTVKKQSLINLCWIVTSSLCFTSCNWVKSYNWFKVSSIIEWNDFKLFIWDWNRNILIKDYIVTFFKDEYQ